MSFALGCFGLGARLRAITTNVGFLRATKGIPEEVTDPELKSALGGARVIAEKDANRPGPRFRWQMWTLFLGALAFIAGHIQQMAQTPSRQPTTTSASTSKAEAPQHQAAPHSEQLPYPLAS
jgi:hypothetical protein